MLWLRRVRRLRSVAAGVFLAAAIVNAFAYPASSDAAPDSDLADYALPDGTVPILCLASGPDQNTDAAHEHCDACLLVFAQLLGVAVTDAASSPVVYTSVSYETEADRAIGQTSEATHHPRAPPPVRLT